MSDWLYVRFVEGKGWDSRLIENYTGCWVSHVELYFPATGETFGAQLHGGTKWRSENNPCYRNVEKYEIWRIPLTRKQTSEVSGLLNELEGRPYDWLAILAFAFSFALLPRHRWHQKGHDICSGILAIVLKRLGLAHIERPVENYAPVNIYDVVTNLFGVEKVS